MTVFANEYTDKLTVTVNGEAMEQQATISIIQTEDGKYTLSLNNFCLESLEDDGSVTRVGVGNIVLPDREGTTVDGITSITYNDVIDITAGDDPNIDFWLGPTLSEFGSIPIEMEARFNDTQLYCEIHINLMDMLAQVIDVVFGTEPEPQNGIHISDVSPISLPADNIYDIQGRKVKSTDLHSLYIVNGKKMIIP
jgi:hypothetical protein